MRIRVDLAYDGGPFHGFAAQRGADLPTVQGTLEGALARLTGQAVATTGAGRTDRGVHALAQVVHLDLEPGRDRVDRFVADFAATRRRLDRMVGDAITIWQVSAVDDAFDARFSATERAYRYRLVDAPVLDPLRRHTRWHVDGPLDAGAMAAAGRGLLGEHDFASFCRRVAGRHTVRRLDDLTVARRPGGGIHVTLRGPAFCHQQVRSIVGCLVAVGRGDHPPAWLGEVRDARDRGAAAPVAPAHGLVLERVRYGDGYPSAPPEPPGT